jgi:hypothetical protein
MRSSSQLVSQVKDDVREAVTQARAQSGPHTAALMKQALDTPHRARAQVAAWISGYNSRNGAGSAQAFIALCLQAAGSTATLQSIDAALATLEAQALVLVNRVRNDSWTWARVATAIDAQVAPDPDEPFDYTRLPIPDGYRTVFDEPW